MVFASESCLQGSMSKARNSTPGHQGTLLGQGVAELAALDQLEVLKAFTFESPSEFLYL